MRTSAAREEEVERGGRGEARKAAPHDQWAETRVGELCRLVNGSAFKPSDWSTEGVPIIRIQNLNDADKPYNYWAGDVDDCVRVRRGDILLAWSGTPGTSFGAHIWDGEDGVLNQHIFRVDLTSDDVTPAWFVWAVNFRLENLIGRAHGAVGLAHVTKGEVQALEIPLPPLAEQERIAGRLTEQLGAVERARAAAAQRLAAAESLPAALLREVFDGPQASGWETRTLGELCDGNGQYGTSAKSNGMERGLPVLGMPHIHEGRIRWARVSYADLPPDELDKYRLVKGDLLFNRTNSAELVGKTAVFDGAKDAVFASYLIRFRVREDMADPRFISAYINSRQGRAFIERYMTRAIGQVNISASTMIGMPIPCPPAPRQREIMDREYSPRLAAAEGVIARCREELAAIEALPAALLRDAFGGWRDGEEPEGA